MKRNQIRYVFPLMAICLLCQSRSFAQDEEQQVDQLFATWNNADAPGASIAVVKDGNIIYKKGFGCANLEYGVPNTPSTVFHVASVSKQVTAFAILLLEEEGKLNLDDDIRKYIPELHDFGKVITLRHLALHNSGLRDQWNLLALAGWRLDDVITTDQILKLIYRQNDLNFNPNEGHLYSNTGYTLLAEVVARVTGQSFAKFTHERIFKPLKMSNTLFYDDHERIVKNRAYSYQPDGDGYRKSVLNYANVGATSLFTTVEDLSLWAMNFENPVVGNREMISKMQVRGILNNGDTLNYALGQDVGTYKGLTLLCHGGSDAGYRSFLARFPDKHFSVAVFSNCASFDPAGMAFRVADIYLKDQFLPEKRAEPQMPDTSNYPGDPLILKEYCGQYELQPGFVVDISLGGDKLFAETREMPKTQLCQVSETDFTVPGLNARVTFAGDPQGGVNQIIVMYNGERMIAPKKGGFNPSSVDILSYSGDFYSPELGTTYTIGVRNNKLYVQHIRLPDFEIVPVSKDIFSGGQWFINKIEFNRDNSGTITGLQVSSARVKNVKFSKIR